MTPAVLILPAYGNAPYLWGAQIALESGLLALIPDYYGSRQENVLREEFLTQTDSVFLSKDLGNLLRPMLRESAAISRFDDWGSRIVSQAPRVQESLQRALESGIRARSLLGEEKQFTEFEFVVNAGTPVPVSGLPTFFAYVAKMSQLYARSQHKSDTIEQVANLWRAAEESFELMFVPVINALSHLRAPSPSENWDKPDSRPDLDLSGIEATPPFARVLQADVPVVVRDSLLFVYSGARLDLEALTDLARKSPLPALTLKSAPSGVDLPRVSVNAYADPRIVAVVARGGWGTIWQSIVNQKPIAILRTPPQVDPEMDHNAKSLRIQGNAIGMAVDGRLDRFIDRIPVLRANVEKVAEDIRREFGTMEGIPYVVERLRAIRVPDR